jgi:hypothetical protein
MVILFAFFSTGVFKGVDLGDWAFYIFCPLVLAIAFALSRRK